MKQPSLIQERSFKFSLLIIDLYKKLIKENEYVLSKQLLRSGTSIGANVSEATAAQSKKDFIAKMSIASKEARETLYWLLLIKEGKLTTHQLDESITEINHIVNILTAIVKTSHHNS